MNTSRLAQVRMRVFGIWFLTLGVVVLVFAEKLSGIRGMPPPFNALFQSFQIMTGLIVPQLATMVAFYLSLDAQASKLERLSREQIRVVTLLSVAYHVLFVVVTIFGIGFYGFDRTADGEALPRNTSAIVSIMGVFSVLLAPVAFLFAKPSESRKADPASGA